MMKVDDKFGRKNILATLEGCEDMWQTELPNYVESI